MSLSSCAGRILSIGISFSIQVRRLREQLLPIEPGKHDGRETAPVCVVGTISLTLVSLYLLVRGSDECAGRR